MEIFVNTMADLGVIVTEGYERYVFTPGTSLTAASAKVTTSAFNVMRGENQK